MSDQNNNGPKLFEEYEKEIAYRCNKRLEDPWAEVTVKRASGAAMFIMLDDLALMIHSEKQARLELEERIGKIEKNLTKDWWDQ